MPGYSNALYMPEASRRAQSAEYAPRLLATVTGSGIDLSSAWLTVNDIAVYSTRDPQSDVARFYVDALLGTKRWSRWTDIGEGCCMALRYWNGQYYVVVAALRLEDGALLKANYPGFLVISLGPP